MWTWFNDPRAVYCAASNSIYLGAVNSSGDVVQDRYWVDTGRIISKTLKAAFNVDDHVNPSLLTLDPTGSYANKLLSVYSDHPGNSFSRRGMVAKTSTAVTVEGSTIFASTAYTNVVQLNNTAQTIYWFLRDGTIAPHAFTTSTDGGITWSAKTIYFDVSSQRPYFQVYASGNRVDFLCTNGHPDEVICNVYHFYMTVDSAGARSWFKSDGTQIGTGDSALPLGTADVTLVYNGASTSSWVWDIFNVGGTLTGAFATYASNSLTTPGGHFYNICTLSGGTWTVTQVCDGGGQANDYLYSGQPHYSGGICLDPNNANAVYVSRKYGATDFRVEKWTLSGSWSKAVDISGNTSSVNMRPTYCRNYPTTQIFYLRGTYTSYTSYSTDAYSYPDLTVNSYSARTKPTPSWQAGSAPAGVNGYWPLTEGSGSTAADAYSTPHNGTFVGSPAWGSGSYGPELGSFSTSAYVAINPASQLIATGSYPWWAALMFKNSGSGDGLGIAIGRSSDTTPFAGLRLNSGGTVNLNEYVCRDNASNINAIQLSQVVNDGNYHVMVGIAWAAADFRIYVDGVEFRATSQSTIGALTSDRMVLGCLLRSSASLAFPGTIVAAACGSGNAPPPEDIYDDWLSGTFAAIRSAGRLSRVSDLGGLGGSGQTQFNPSLSGV